METDSSTATNNDIAGTERTTIPVYAVWISKKNDNRSYDGMYDSATHYMKLCESKQKIHIDNPSEVALSPDNKCFNQVLYDMITISKDSGAPLFLNVLHVDSAQRRIVGVTDNNDTIETSVGNMSNASFEKLKREYQVTPFSKSEENKIKQYYSPGMKKQNEAKKEQIMKMKSQALHE